MNRKRRTEILIKGSPNIAATLAQAIIERYEIKSIEEPNHGLVMVKMRETAKKSLFYLGEVFVTECKVQINGHLGIGIVKGDDGELAYHLAVIDAAYRAGLQETTAWTALLLTEEENINARQKARNQAVLRTKVSFATMDVE